MFHHLHWQLRQLRPQVGVGGFPGGPRGSSTRLLQLGEGGDDATVLVEALGGFGAVAVDEEKSPGVFSFSDGEMVVSWWLMMGEMVEKSWVNGWSIKSYLMPTWWFIGD